MPSFIRAVAITGLIAGTLDITAASIQFLNNHPQSSVRTMLTAIASAAFGQEAFNGNPVMPWIGLLFHFIIAYSFTILFFLLYERMEVLRKQPIVSGMLYAIVVYSTMQYLVLPLTKLPLQKLPLPAILIGIGILMVVFGIPVSLGARSYYRRKFN
ncbi:hypothetical protein DVR12_15205 [Chitinophaga silvatica]|uniref:DUF1440 domain-containing protein n=1 Tax=Chitinophaga silvatica TaxID=2282649 RepID=A0A3E1Y959_9BACT|nr:hypothetical protein [Chitinophaga silvatica]RFS21989.1 hypothetical protein DVR12_15205 [Chitinophaga silvatica]